MMMHRQLFVLRGGGFQTDDAVQGCEKKRQRIPMHQSHGSGLGSHRCSGEGGLGRRQM